MRVFLAAILTIVYVLSLFLPLAGRVPVFAAGTPTAIFPADRDFLIPVEDAGGPLRMSILSPTALGGPKIPRRRLEFDAPGGTVTYRVSQFASVSDAVASLLWQRQLLVNQHLLVHA